MTTLKEARETGALAKFAKEHRRDPKGNATAFNQTLKAMAGKSKPVLKTSSADDPAD
jgi:hypothetical protein